MGFTVQVTENTTGAPRTGTITVTAGDADPVTVTVNQEAQDSLSVSPEALDFDYTGEPAQTVTVTTSADDYTATSTEDWVNITQNNGTFTVTLDANDTGAERTGTITINAGTANPVTITVTQAAQATLEVNPMSLTFGYDDADPQTVDVITSAPVYTAEPNEDWITVIPDAQGFDVHVEPHHGDDIRNAKITVNDDMSSEFEVSVEQLFPPYDHKVSIELADADGILMFSGSATSEVQRVNVSTKARLEDLKVDSSAWITGQVVAPGVLTVQCALNDTGAEREGFVTVYGDNAYPASLRIIQGQW